MNLIVEMYHGSHLYGTASATSDVDIKGIATASPRDVLLGTIPKIVAETHPVKGEGQKNAPGDIDRTIFSLHHFIHLALKGETVAIDNAARPGFRHHQRRRAVLGLAGPQSSQVLHQAHDRAGGLRPAPGREVRPEGVASGSGQARHGEFGIAGLAQDRGTVD